MKTNLLISTNSDIRKIENASFQAKRELEKTGSDRVELIKFIRDTQEFLRELETFRTGLV